VPGAEACASPQRHMAPSYQIGKFPGFVQPSDVAQIQLSFSAPRFHAGVAGPAVPGSGSVHDHPSRRDFFRARVTESARNAPVSACQLESRCPVVVKRRWLPFDEPMTTGTVGWISPRRKLAPVNILVAPRASFGSRSEGNVFQAWLQAAIPVAGITRDGPVRTLEREEGRGVVKAGNRFPSLRRVACLTTLWSAIRPDCCHRVRKLTLVRICVAIVAVMAAKTERCRRRRINIRPAFVALRTEVGGVTSCKGEAGLHVPCQCERGRAESLHRVAALAPVLIGGAQELAIVYIGMADGAAAAREPEPGFRAPWFVTLGARYRGVLLCQLEARGCVQ
jgi:hypothetical protein